MMLALSWPAALVAAVAIYVGLPLLIIFFVAVVLAMLRP